MQKNLLSIIALIILYLQINFIVFVPAPICCAKYPVWKLFFIQNRQLSFRNPLKGLQHPQNMKTKKIHMKGIVVYDQISHSVKSNGFLFDCALCHLPNTIHLTKVHPRNAIVSFSTSKMPSGILAEQKLKILHERTYSVQLNGIFYCAKLMFIWLCPWQFVKYHLQLLQFGVHCIAPNLVDIAQPHLLGSILIRHCWRRSQPLFVPFKSLAFCLGFF